jgi:hypothetical protein
MELKSPNPITWTSQLNNSLNLSEAKWPTQNFGVVVGPFSYPIVREVTSVSHAPGIWSQVVTTTIGWREPDDPIGTDRYYYRWRNFSDWQETTDTEITTTLPEGDNWEFEVYSQAIDGETNDTVKIGPFKIDVTPPEIMLLSLGYPQALNTLSFPVDWSGSRDNSQDTIHFDVQYKAQYWNEDSPGDWIDWLLDTTLIADTFTAADDGTFWFRIRGRDEAGNQSEWVEVKGKVITHPYLAVNQNPLGLLSWTVSYSDTTPRTGSLSIFNEGIGTLTWTLKTEIGFPWVTTGATSGEQNATVPLTLTNPGITNTYRSIITVASQSGVRRSPLTLPIEIKVVDRLYEVYLPLLLKQGS